MFEYSYFILLNAHLPTFVRETIQSITMYVKPIKLGNMVSLSFSIRKQGNIIIVAMKSFNIFLIIFFNAYKV